MAMTRRQGLLPALLALAMIDGLDVRGTVAVWALRGDVTRSRGLYLRGVRSRENPDENGDTDSGSPSPAQHVVEAC